MDFLERIVAHKKELVAQKRPIYDALKKQLGNDEYTRYGLFKREITRTGKINIIAEIKKASPSKGLIREDFDVLQIAREYEEHGAAAISVLTEENFFGGDVRYVKRVVDNFHRPVLAKDFFIDPGQIYEARLNGASAILLIMAILTDAQMREFSDVAHDLDLDCLVEVHSEEDLMRALDCGADIIGINHRDLKTFNMDMELSKRLIPLIPEGKVIVAESGLDSRERLNELRDLGVNAFLIGEYFMREKDIGRKMDELLSD